MSTRGSTKAIRPAARSERRAPRLALLLALLPLLVAPVAGAQPTPIAPPAAPLDLAAMTLTPDDLLEPGFALAGGGAVDLPAEAARLARVRGRTRRADAAAITDALHAAGWQRRYESRLAAPDPETPNRVGAEVRSAVAEHADPAGAAAAFALLAEGGAAAAERPLRGLVPLGEESRLTRAFVPVGGDRPPAQRLELTVRVGNLLVSVAITDLSGERGWGVLAVERLAASLLARVAAVRAGDAPRLAPRLLRLAPSLPAPAVSDVYDRLAGRTFPLFGVDPDDAADREVLYDPATDVYTYERVAPLAVPGAAPGAAPYYAAKLYRFPDAAAAAAWLARAPERLVADPGSFLDLAPVEGVAVIGDASRTVAYGFVPPGADVVTRGYRVYARVGSEIARVQLDADPPVPLAAVEALARAQVACLAAPACPPAPFPTDLLAPATPTP